MQLTITGGKHKGKKLHLPVSFNGFRPTLSKVRESVFNILGQDLTQINFIDAFAGSGIMGIEALSRGAKEVFFFEKNPGLTEILADHLEMFSRDRYEIYEGDLFSILPTLSLPPGIIYLDPPHSMKLETVTLENLAPMLALPSLVILECPASTPVTIPECYDVMKNKKYGNSRLIVLEYSK